MVQKVQVARQKYSYFRSSRIIRDIVYRYCPRATRAKANGSFRQQAHVEFVKWVELPAISILILFIYKNYNKVKSSLKSISYPNQVYFIIFSFYMLLRGIFTNCIRLILVWFLSIKTRFLMLFIIVAMQTVILKRNL